MAAMEQQGLLLPAAAAELLLLLRASLAGLGRGEVRVVGGELGPGVGGEVVEGGGEVVEMMELVEMEELVVGGSE